MLIEVKPFNQTQEPKKRSKLTKQYITEVSTWAINQEKWKVASEYCLDRGWTFHIWHEEHLGIAK